MTKPDPARPYVRLPTAVLVVSALWFIAVAVWGSDTGVDFMGFFLLFFAAIIWGVVWLFRLAVWALRVPRPRPRMRAWLYWGMEPAVFVLTLALLFSGAQQQARFYLSYSSLQAYAEDVSAGKVSGQGRFDPGRRVGLYSVYRTERLPDGGVRFITSDAGMGDVAGFAYSPAGKPPRLGEDSYSRISGPWWFWYQSW